MNQISNKNESIYGDLNKINGKIAEAISLNDNNATRNLIDARRQILADLNIERVPYTSINGYNKYRTSKSSEILKSISVRGQIG